MVPNQRRDKPLILNVDDHEAGRYAISRVLRGAGFGVTEASSGTEALTQVATKPPDLVLLDVNLPDISGFEVCHRIKSDPQTAHIPVLHISASSIEASHQAHGLNSGADNYLTEPVEPEVLLATIRATLRIREAEDAMRLLAEQWQTTFDAMSDGVALLDREGRIVRWNRALERLTGRVAERLSGEICYHLWEPASEPPDRFAFIRMADSLRREELDVQHRGRWFHVTVDPVLTGPSRELNGAVYVVADVTERKQLEEQFREAQKFESIGQLAGGVAHDFNNLLTSIMGNASLVLSDLAPDHPFREKIEEVMRASNRAADLTRQLLAYSGKGRFILRRLDVSAIISEMEGLLRSSVPKKVLLEIALAKGLPLVEADPAQIQQALFNLVINAAEAIGEAPGTIRVATGIKHVSEPTGDATAGDYVWLEVRDTGCGMDEHVRTRLFDPFFTTKFTGRGLGLSAVSGIVRGHRGMIEISSEPAKGTTFRVLMPAVVTAPRPAVVRAHVGSGTVLVADDEDMVRRMAKATLEIRGYKVLLAVNGQEAVDIIRESGREIGVVLLDMMMPVMAGEEAMEHIVRMYPGMRVIATSGYDEQEAARRFGSRISGFLQKPYTSRQLAEKIKGTMDAAPATAP
ncbi:MAG TPA: response regulator [Bryobacteraceae bacterium]|nr:response regulator [Bryobacteraceae bacterium]